MPIVDIRSVTKSFGSRVIFSDVSLTVHQSEVVAIIGPSGAGKSTLIRCINGLTPFEFGSIEVLGRTLVGTEERSLGVKTSKADLRQVQTQVGMVFQTFNLFPHLTALGNVMLGPVKALRISKAEAEANARRLLDTVGLAARADAHPRNLSGGEQQRVAICRALAMGPKVMLFDEPTSMLDPELVGDVLEVIRQLVDGGMTTILVTHEMHFAREVADTVVMMADASIVEQGSAEELFRRPKTDRAKSFLSRMMRYTSTQEEMPERADDENTPIVKRDRGFA